MGFPGRLEEKKKISFGFWLVVAIVLSVLFWCVWKVTQAVNGPMPKPAQKEQMYDESPGLIRNTAGRLQDSTAQIVEGKPLGKVKQRPVKSRSVVVYDSPKAEPRQDASTSSDYYSAE